MTFWPEAVLLASGALLAAFFSGAETGAYVINRLRLRHLVRNRGARWAERVESLIENPPVFVTAMLIWTNISLYLATAACTALYTETAVAHQAALAATLTLAPPLFILAELAPKNVFRLRAEDMMARSARALWAAVALARPAAVVLSGAGGLVRKALRLPEPRHWATVSRRAVRTQIAEGALSPAQRALVERILLAGSQPALRAAVPVGEFPSLPEDATAGDLLSRAGTLRGLRAPVHRDAPDRIVGVVHLLRAWSAPAGTPLAEIARPPVLLDEKASVMGVLGELRRARESLGVIARPAAEGAREPARARAVVTVEDLLRYLVAGTPGGGAVC
jgi:CBS domain containing-hemolysin-like protein